MHTKFHRNSLECAACGRHSLLMFTYQRPGYPPGCYQVHVTSCWRSSCRRLVTVWPS